MEQGAESEKGTSLCLVFKGQPLLISILLPDASFLKNNSSLYGTNLQNQKKKKKIVNESGSNHNARVTGSPCHSKVRLSQDTPVISMSLNLLIF